MNAENRKFYALLRELTTEGERPRRYNVTVLAKAIGANRDHVNRVINNHPSSGQLFAGIGGRTRARIARHFRQRFPVQAGLLLDSLGWDGEGRLKQ